MLLGETRVHHSSVVHGCNVRQHSPASSLVAKADSASHRFTTICVEHNRKGATRSGTALKQGKSIRQLGRPLPSVYVCVSRHLYLVSLKKVPAAIRLRLRLRACQHVYFTLTPRHLAPYPTIDIHPRGHHRCCRLPHLTVVFIFGSVWFPFSSPAVYRPAVYSLQATDASVSFPARVTSHAALRFNGFTRHSHLRCLSVWLRRGSQWSWPSESLRDVTYQGGASGPSQGQGSGQVSPGPLQ